MSLVTEDQPYSSWSDFNLQILLQLWDDLDFSVDNYPSWLGLSVPSCLRLCWSPETASPAVEELQVQQDLALRVLGWGWAGLQLLVWSHAGLQPGLWCWGEWTLLGAHLNLSKWLDFWFLSGLDLVWIWSWSGIDLGFIWSWSGLFLWSWYYDLLVLIWSWSGLDLVLLLWSIGIDLVLIWCWFGLVLVLTSVLDLFFFFWSWYLGLLVLISCLDPWYWSLVNGPVISVLVPPHLLSYRESSGWVLSLYAALSFLYMLHCPRYRPCQLNPMNLNTNLILSC